MIQNYHKKVEGLFWSADSAKDSFWISNDICPKVDSALYKIIIDSQGTLLLKKNPLITDELIILKEEYQDQIISEIDNFWKKEEEFKKRGFVFKRGILMFGEPGVGKTALIQLVLKDFITNDGIALIGASASSTYTALQTIRMIEPDRPILVIIEDADQVLEQPGWLSILDGELQVNKVIYIATTNYIEKIDKRFIDRPSRFDLIIPVEAPSAKARALYLKTKEPLMPLSEIQKWTELSKGFTMAHLKELLISVKCLGYSVEVVAKRVKAMQDRAFTNEDFRKNKTGFGFASTLPDKENIDWISFEKEYF